MRKIAIPGFLFLLVAIVALTIKFRPHAVASPVRTALAGPTLPGDPQTPEAKMAHCKGLMDYADHKLLAWKSWRRVGNKVTVVIGPGYYLANADNRAAFDSVVRCVATDGQGDELAQVNYIDYRTHRRLAEWNKSTGFHVRN